MSFAVWNIITLATIFASAGGVLLVRKLTDRQQLKDNHPVTDPLMATVGMLFAILLGFMVANAMTRFEECRLNVQAESGAVGDLFRLSRGLTDPTKSGVMINCLKYIDSVVDEEWPLMASEKMSDKTQVIYSEMWSQVTAFEPKTQGQSNLHQSLVASMTKLGECRRTRASQIQSHMPIVLWFVVGIGALVTVSFSFFFGLDSVKLQMTMTALLTYVLCMNVYLLISFNDPFSGDVKIKPIAFAVNQTLFRHALGKNVK
jgi:hypothetical protein